MAYQDNTNLYTNTKYIVSSTGATPYTTIQSAINAANTAGIPAIIYIRPGTYTENLTLYSQIDLEGGESTEVTIIGKHTPPATGSLNITRIGFSAAGTDSVLTSAAAGTTNIKFTRCNFSVADGYICDLTNWTGSITFKYCDESSTSVKNGIVNNAGAATIYIKNSQLGSGTDNSLISNGVLQFNNADIGCPIALSGVGVSVIQGGSTLRGTVVVSADADLQISNSRMPTGATPCLSTTSTVAVKCSNVVMDTSNTYAVTTTGTGSYKPSEVTFPNSKGINASITEILTGVVKTGEIFADTITRMSVTGFYSWAAGGPYFDDTTIGSFTVLVGGTGYIQGRLVTWSGGQTIAGLVAGNTYLIYMDGTGTIGKAIYSPAAHDIYYTDNIVLFQCMRDSTTGTNIQVTVAENHPYNFQTYPSLYLHDVIGPVIENVNNGANIIISGTQKVGISGDDVLSDHGLSTNITAIATVTSWRKYYTDAGGKWAQQNATDTFSGYYNSAGTPTALGGSKFGVYTLYVGKDNLNSADPIYFAVLDTSQYNTSGAANTAIANGTTARASNELLYLELAQLGYIIFSQAANAITSVIISKATLKQTLSTGGTNTAALVTTNTTNFDGMLSVSDTNVQAALETIDEFGKNLTDHALVIGNGNGLPLGVIAVGATGETLMGSTGADCGWTSSPSFGGSITAGTTITGTLGDLTLTDGDAIISNRDAAITSPIVYFKKNRAGAALSSGDLVGTLKFSGYDGTQYTDGARITSTSSGTIANTRVASDLKFYTHPDSAAADPTLRLTIASTGATTIAAPDSGTGLTVSGGGITCTSGAITATSGNVVISSGNLTLPRTTSTVGQILLEATPVFHMYGPAAGTNTTNLFLGQNSGNFTLTTASANCNVGLGVYTLNALTTGIKNLAIGDNSCRSLKTGQYNCALGSQSLYFLNGGSKNVAIGLNALGSIVNSNYNTSVGTNTLLNLTSGANNVCIGTDNGSGTGWSGQAYTGSESSNIIIQNSGTVGESNKIRIGTQGSGTGQQDATYIAGIYNTAVGATAGVVLSDSAHKLGGLAGSAGQVLQGGTKPAFSTTTYPSTTAKGDILAASAANTITTIAAGTTGQVLQAVTNDKPAYSTATYPLTAAIGDILVASAANVIGVVAGGSATTGHVLTATNGAAPSFQAPTGGGGITWSVITANQTAAIDNGYICNKAGLLELALPTTCAAGKTIRVTGMNTALGWKVTQAANQIIHFGTSDTTTGAAGYIASTETRDSVELVCCVADLEFNVVSSIGNITIA